MIAIVAGVCAVCATVPAAAAAQANAQAASRRSAADVQRPAVFPPRDRVRAVRTYLARRDARVSFALIDTRGHAYGLAPERVFSSASVVKAMLLVAYLRAIAPRGVNASERALLGPMIVRSSNRAATSVYGRLGSMPLLALAQRAGMRHFAIAGSWSSAQIAAADQARFLRLLDRIVPSVSRAYARRLLSSIVAHQRWGFSRFAEPAGFTTFFKGGWRPTASGLLVHEVARFERGRERFSLAVLSDANRSYAYGAATLRGVARRIFGGRDHGPVPIPSRAAADLAGGPAHRRAGLVDVHRYAPGIALDIRYATRRNLTGKRLPGYCRPWALLLDRPARDLARVQRRLRRSGLGLKVFDAYRPARATRALVRWARRSGRGDLVGTYIASRSRHNVGSTVDLTLVRLSDGRQLRMGSGYDELNARAHTLNAHGRALANRLTLQRAMERFGFAPYAREWWHFEHRGVTGPALDLPLGCG